MRSDGKLMVAGCVILLLLSACSGDNNKRFRLVPASESGLTFKNVLTPAADFNILNYMYFYNGGGVAIGDFNNDSLPDIFFTANQEFDKLFLNRGNLKFEDVTEISGTQGLTGWTTGVTTADVNGDGLLDIYVCNLGDYLIYKGRNQLFINEGNNADGIPVFTDRAVEYGLDLVGFATQATFFDYDKDGDLDMFMLNHSLHQQGTFGKSKLRYTPHPLAGDKLMRNENGRFIDVTAESGIYSSVIGYGLGVVVSDVNLDGWPDIYVGNDFHENDYLYINQGDGTFKESLESSMRHTSRFTMGVDFGDINNDAFPDLISMDMLPNDPQILKASAAEDAYDVYNYKIGFGYHHQFARNTLQVNNRDNTFSDIALQAGVSSTDWSWSTLLCDFDLDGYKDIFVANGIPRRPNDLDYVNFMSADSIRFRLEEEVTDSDLAYIDQMPKIKISNVLFQNKHNQTFIDQATAWGLDKPSYSNGAAYADLDNDGDIDIVTNNLEEDAFLFENRTINKKGNNTDTKHFLQVVLKGSGGNTKGIGAKVLLYDSGSLQLQECMPTRGFQSAVDYPITFGTSGKVDSLVVVWNDGSFQTIIKPQSNRRIIVSQENAKGTFDYTRFHQRSPLFRAADELNIPFKHKENKFVEFSREQLLPHMMSSEGPAAAVGDINGDGREDIFLGGAKWQEAAMFIQTPGGTFVRAPQPAISADSLYENVDAVFVDVDGDDDNDLVVVSGGNEFSGKSVYCNPLLYTNDGKGNFTKTTQFAELFLTGSCVAPADIDKDGDIDLFIGARTTPWRYGIKPDSYLLVNDGKGNFSLSQENSDVMKELGFVKDAIWTDIDNDNDDDLIIAAEWSPVIIMLNDRGKLTKMNLEGSGLDGVNGWWNVVEAFDADGDGDMDLIAGNLGLNSKLKTSKEQPVRMFVADFDKNDSTDQVLSHYVNGREYPFHTRDEMTRQMPYLKKRYLSYRKFSEATLHTMFSDEELNKAQQYTATEFRSVFIENLGQNKFQIHPLPPEAQISTINAVIVDDFNGDKTLDLFVAGNFYPINIQMGRNDASYGLLLTGKGGGEFQPVPPDQSGLSIKGEVRYLRTIHVGGKTYYLAIRNNETVAAVTTVK